MGFKLPIKKTASKKEVEVKIAMATLYASSPFINKKRKQELITKLGRSKWLDK